MSWTLFCNFKGHLDYIPLNLVELDWGRNSNWSRESFVALAGKCGLLICTRKILYYVSLHCVRHIFNLDQGTSKHFEILFLPVSSCNKFTSQCTLCGAPNVQFNRVSKGSTSSQLWHTNTDFISHFMHILNSVEMSIA